MLSNEFGFQKERHCIILQKIKLSSHWIINIRKPSSKDKEREKKLFAQQAQQQKFQQQAQQKQKQNKKNNKNKNNTNNTRNDNNNKITILNTLNTNTDLNINLGNGAPTDNSHNHLTTNYNIYSASLDTTANDNHINFPSQVIESWFIKNKPKYATVSKILRKLYAFYILSICLLIFVAGMVVYYDEIIYTILQGLLRLLLLLIPLIGIRYLWTKTPTNVNDSFFFRDEMRKLMYVIIVTVGVYALLVLLTIVNGIIKKHINKKTFAFIEFTQFENDELIEPLVSSYGSLSRDSLGETTIEVRMKKQDERVGPFMQFLQAISALCGVLAPIFIQISFEISDGYA